MASSLDSGIDSRSSTSGSAAQTSSSSSSALPSAPIYRAPLESGAALRFLQLRALLRKRWLHHSREPRYILSTLVLPSALVATAMTLALLRPAADYPPLLLTPAIYGDDVSSYVR